MMGSPAPPRYRILDQIGAGGMGVVYRAEETALGRQVALKFLPSDYLDRPDLLARFEREARAAAALNHPNVCTIYGVGTIQPGEEPEGRDDSPGRPPFAGSPFIAMEYIQGETLRSVLHGRRPPLRESLKIASEIAEGLSHAHRAGVIHRDLKPGNIMITPEGRVKLLDFGLAKFVQEAATAPSPSDLSHVETLSAEVTRHGEVIGTSAYMSPEQARGLRLDHRTDIFSFGVVLYEMLAGRPPFTGPTRSDILGSLLRDQPPPLAAVHPEVTPELDRILGKCLEKEPGYRYQNATDLAVDLRRLRETTQVPAGAAKRATGPRKRGTIRAAGAILGVAAVAIIAALALRGCPRPSPTGEPIDVAILPLVYEGPADRSYLKEVLPLVLAEGMRAEPRIRVAPIGSSKDFSADEDPHAVAGQLGVEWLVTGKVALDGDRFQAAVRVTRGDDSSTVLEREVSGEFTAIIAGFEPLSREIAESFGARLPREGEHRDASAMIEYLRGVALLEGADIRSNAAAAEAAFRAALAEDSGFNEARARLAVALISRFLRTRDASVIEEAARIAAEAAALSPSLPETQQALGMVQLAQGKSAEAAASFERALKSAPADDALFRNIATAYASLSRDEEAEAMYRRAVELRPAYWAGYNVWGTFHFRRGNLERAKELFRKAIEFRPESDAGYSNLAAVLILSGRHAEAEPLLQAALRLNPTVQTRNNLGVVCYALGRFEEAARIWGDAAAGTNDAMLYSNLGDAHRQLRDSVAARAAYERAIEIGEARLAAAPNDGEARAMTANALAGIGRCAEARREAARSSSENSANPAVAYYAAVASAICGNRGDAVRYTLQAIRGGVVADVRTNPDLKPLLDDPEIVEALSKTPVSP